MGGNAAASGRGKWSALMAALLGWMFDGLEMGLFPLVASPALAELLGSSSQAVIGPWFAVATAAFLVGAATGGVLFGWVGDRFGRVRALTLSVLTYALFSGLCAFAQAPEQIVVLRFVSALGMGGEWSLGVALVMEVWPNRSRALLAGLIGAAANAGYMLIAILGLSLGRIPGPVGNALTGLGLPAPWVEALVANSGWRLLMLLGATPAVLTFFIRIFVPESGRWEAEKAQGKTSGWETRDLLGVLAGAAACCGLIFLWAVELPWPLRIVGSVMALVLITLCYLYPVVRYLRRTGATDQVGGAGGTVRRMLLGACLSGVPLLATWAAIQWAPVWADQLAQQRPRAQATAAAVVASLGSAPHAPAAWSMIWAAPVPFAKDPESKALTQIFSALGAIIGTVLAAYLGDWLGRRLSYVLLCLLSLGSTVLFFRTNDSVGAYFLCTAFLAGACTASFYGWLPLYLPELFRTRVRATGQGFSFNFGRILAAVGTLQLVPLLAHYGYAEACSLMALIYLVGLVVIWLAPETRGRPLPE
jgi:MFS family permease